MAEDNEIPLDIKNDIELAFNLYKNENNKINKLKLRTILFSFVMYKYSASDINEFIESRTLKDKELYTFDDVCDLVKEKMMDSKERESDELFNYIVNNKKDKAEINKMNKKQLKDAFKENEINIEDKDLDQMIEYMQKKENDEEEEDVNQNNDKKPDEIERNDFKKFFIGQK